MAMSNPNSYQWKPVLGLTSNHEPDENTILPLSDFFFIVIQILVALCWKSNNKNIIIKLL